MEKGYKECPECKGYGSFTTSTCCGSEPFSNGDGSTADYGICPECGEHCDYETDICETCLGTGEVERDEEDDFKDKMHEAERKYESEINDNE